ncbi:hypothetical protein Q669_29630 [Labrenzia sp. C1B10]|uniref:hypothetical protein n=1 Tax=unclassified Labrenzia TaxID=2648686 RepID=UPI0003B8F23D|nr:MULTISPECIES: hypothetical protein [unclassified Labrenzia]ERP95732.1 hypothetical protein Q669_29630 [Labrenzia sp. C1B10]ERS05798.1 hypothetical protein Q675_29195 [Labrenzia sp. C1B70]
MVLNLEPKTKEHCKRAIGWQRSHGQNKSPMHICRYDVESDSFVSTGDESRKFQPNRKPFTETSWLRFKGRLRFDVMTHAERLDHIWKTKHSDYKGKIDGKRYILIQRNGTASVPLSSLTESEIRREFF